MTVEHRSFSGFITGKNIFRVGLGLLLLGLFLLFKLGIDEGWIGPEVRLAAGAVTSAALVGIGLSIAGRRPTFGTLLQGGGLAGLFATIYAGHAVMALVGETAAYIQMGVVVAGAIALALRSDAEALATVGVAGGLVAPIIIGESGFFDLRDVAYVAVLFGLASLLFTMRSWTVLYGVAAGVGALLLVPQALLDSAPAAALLPIQLGLAAYWLAFFPVPVFMAVAGRLSVRAEVAAQVGAVAVPLLAFGASALLWFDESTRVLLGGIAGVLALVHVAIRAGVARMEDTDTADVQLIPAAFFALSAPILALGGPFLLPTLAAVGLALIVGGALIGRPSAEALGHATLVLVTLRAFISQELLNLFKSGFDIDSLGTLGVLLILAVTGIVFLSGRLPTDSQAEVVGRLYLGVAYFGGGLWGWLAFGGAELGAVTVVWGVLGLLALIIGLAADDAGVLSIGGATLLITVGKLLLIDLVFVDAIWRILLFIGFGLEFLALGYWIATRRGEV